MLYSQRLAGMEARFEELTRLMADPAVINDSDLYRKTTKAQSDLAEVVHKYREWKAVHENLEQARQMLHDSDAEMRAMAEDEIARLDPELARLEDELRILLLPKD